MGRQVFYEYWAIYEPLSLFWNTQAGEKAGG